LEYEQPWLYFFPIVGLENLTGVFAEYGTGNLKLAQNTTARMLIGYA
jgi:hypothetical protein